MGRDGAKLAKGAGDGGFGYTGLTVGIGGVLLILAWRFWTGPDDAGATVETAVAALGGAGVVLVIVGAVHAILVLSKRKAARRGVDRNGAA